MNPCDIFCAYQQRIVQIVKTSPLPYADPRVLSDIAPCMFIICDFAILSAQKDRYSIMGILRHWYFQDKNSADKQWFDMRTNFYASIIRGEHSVGLCMPGSDIDTPNLSPCVRCAIAFCDCMMHPDLIEDYDSGALTLVDMFQIIDFSSSMVSPIAKELTELFKDFYSL